MHATLMQLIAQVAEAFGVTVAEVQGARRTRAIVEARAAAAWALRRCAPTLTLAAIGELLGGRHHTTVIHALGRVEARMRADAAYTAALETLAAPYLGAAPVAPAPVAPAPVAPSVVRLTGAAWWVAQATPPGALSA